jgi:hypothetical protein
LSEECCCGEKTEPKCGAGTGSGGGGDHFRANPDGSWEHWFEDAYGNDIRHMKWGRPQPGQPLSGQFHVDPNGTSGQIFEPGQWKVQWTPLWDDGNPSGMSEQRFDCELHGGNSTVTILRNAEKDEIEIVRASEMTVTDRHTVAVAGEDGATVTDEEIVDVVDRTTTHLTIHHLEDGLPFHGRPDADPDPSSAAPIQ